MKVSYDILQKFVTAPKKLTARQLADTLTMSVVEVDGWEDQAERLAHIVVGLVTKVEVHPNADKLKLATVDCGKEKFDVVCGGVNIRVGMKVAFAKVGSRVRWHGQGDWVKLTAAKIRGVESHGMICAAEELELPDDAAVEHGVMDLSHLPAKSGTPLADALELTDIILEIDNKSITHRPDLWGHLGVARELAALWKTSLHEPQLPQLAPEIDVPLMVSSKASAGLVRYLGLALDGIKVAESPAWLKQALHSLGHRPVNNVVDVTNYVMLEMGQPLHAFDLEKLASAEIVVRYAKKGEQLAMLDGVTRELDAETLVIADRKKALAVAGVIGGAASGVTLDTKAIVLEAATFEAVGVRATAARLGLRTDASARFEKALDPELAEAAMKRAVSLLSEVCPGSRIASPIVDVFPKVLPKHTITLPLPWLYKRLGDELPAKEVLDILHRLGFATREKDGDVIVTVPSWRAARDITIPEDLVEEVARIWGYGRLPRTMPKFDIVPPWRDQAQDLRWKIRDLMVGAGWTETLSYSFVSKGMLELENPVDQTKRYLRPTLASSLREQFDAACRAGAGDVKLFELGRVFTGKSSALPAGDGGSSRLPAQPWHLALALRDTTVSDNFRAVKGALELIERELWVKLEPVYAAVGAGVVAETSLEGVAEPGSVREFTPIPKYPSVVRALSVITPGTPWAQVEQAVRSIDPLVHGVRGIDVYEVSGAGTSTTAEITFRSPERTLKSAEVDEVMEKITRLLKDTFNATIR